MAFNFFTAFHRALQDPESYFSFQKEMNSKAVEQTFFNSLSGKTSFDAVVLPEDINSTTYASGSSVLRVRPLELHDFILPEPCEYAGDPEKINKIISMHPVAYPDNLVPLNLGSQNSPHPGFQAGQIVECFFLTGPQTNGKMRGIRYRNSKFSAVNNINLTCLGGQDKGAKSAMANGYNSGGYRPDKGNYRGIAGDQQIINGQLPTTVLGKTNSGIHIMIDVVEDLNKLEADFMKEFNIPLVYSGYRFFETQIKLYNDPSKIKADGTHLAAEPGTSNHGWGLAIDIDTSILGSNPEAGFKTNKYYNWLWNNGSGRHNWKHPKWAQEPDGWPNVKKAEAGQKGSKPENWHWEWSKRDTVLTILPRDKKK